MNKIRPWIFEAAADRIKTRDNVLTCVALNDLGSSESEDGSWSECHCNDNGDHIMGIGWFGNYLDPDNQILREQLLREMALNLRNHGY